MSKEGGAVGDVFTLDHLKQLIEEAEKYAFLTAEVATADVGNNAGEKLDDKEVRLIGDAISLRKRVWVRSGTCFKNSISAS